MILLQQDLPQELHQAEGKDSLLNLTGLGNPPFHSHSQGADYDFRDLSKTQQTHLP